MALYDVRITGYEAIEADTPNQAIEKFYEMMENGYKVSDLRWKKLDTIASGIVIEGPEIIHLKGERNEETISSGDTERPRS